MTTIINAATSGGLIQTADTSGVLQLQTASTAALTVDASQNVGIGTASPSQKLDVVGTARVSNTSGNKYLYIGQSTPAGNDGSSLEFQNSNSQKNWAIRSNFNVGGALEFCPSSAAGGTTYTSPSMVINSSGNVLVGQTSAPLALGSSCQIANASGLGQFSGGDGSLARTFSFGRDNVTTGAFVFTFNGSVISQIGAGTGIYTAVSDSRLKKNITPLNYGLNEILELNPVMYNMKTESDDTKKHIGLLAQEVKSVIDESVDDLTVLTEEMKDAGAKEQYYGLDKSGLVPVLIKAIQELNAKVDAQALEIQALKGAK
jgi:hypothetical protein